MLLVQTKQTLPQGLRLGLQVGQCLEGRPQCESVDLDDRIVRSAKVDASSFDGHLDPKEYLDRKMGMDHFFEWYDMIESRKIQYAKMKLLGQASYTGIIFWS